MSDSDGIRNLVGSGLVQLVGGMVTAVLYQPMPITPSMNECFKPALEWVRHTHAEDLKAIYPKDQFAPSAETARRWRELLIEWRKTTGKPAIDLSQKPQ